MNLNEKYYSSPNGQGSHKIVYSDWEPAGPLKDGAPVVCVHGLTGNGHDFDELAEALVRQGRRVIAVDLPGRGRSGFLPDPLDYNYTQYCQDLNTLLTHLDADKPASVDWIGVSLGGLLGIRLAGMENSPIRRLILNDVGPEVPKPALDFICKVISQVYMFDSVADLEKRMRETRGLTWGPVTDMQWRSMAEHNARSLGNGKITYGYDPKIAVIFENEPTGETDLWAYWKQISCPVLVIQGGKSVVLTDAIVQQMREGGPQFDLKVFKDCGHVPSLMAPEHIETIEKWLSTKPI